MGLVIPVMHYRQSMLRGSLKELPYFHTLEASQSTREDADRLIEGGRVPRQPRGNLL